jgi:hypothetical protein
VTYASHGTELQHLKGQFWIERRAKEISQHEVEGEFNSILHQRGHTIEEIGDLDLIRAR